MIEQRLGYWQSKLRLMDWTIRAGICARYELGHPYANADVVYDAKTRVATIRVVRESDFYARLPGLKFDLDRSLIHELLHLKFVWFDGFIERERALLPVLEASIEALTETILSE